MTVEWTNCSLCAFKVQQYARKAALAVAQIQAVLAERRKGEKDDIRFSDGFSIGKIQLKKQTNYCI